MQQDFAVYVCFMYSCIRLICFLRCDKLKIVFYPENPMKRFYMFVFFLIFSFMLYAEKSIYEEILSYRLEKDNGYTYLVLEALIAKNNFQKTKNNAAAAFIFGTGDMTLTMSKDKNKRGFSAAPFADLSFPLLNNAALKVSAPYEQAGGVKSYGAAIGVSAQLFGEARKQTKLHLRQAEDIWRKAEKKAAYGAELTEKKLLSDIQNLFNEYVALLDKETDETQANINYEKVKAQGYGETSSKSRASKLSLLTAERERKQADFSFSVTYKKFLQSCGRDEEKNSAQDFLVRLAQAIPDKEVVSIDGFTVENYIPVKEAKRKYADDAASRNLAVSLFSVNAQTGYSYKKTNAASIAENKSSDTHTVSAGLSMELPGTKLSAGVEIPVDGKNSDQTVFKTGISFNPIAVWNYTLDKKSTAAKNKIEDLQLSDLINSFDTEFKTIKIKRENIQWQKKVCFEELSIYKQNDEDHKAWFEKGLASSFEKMQAELEYKKALARFVNAKINSAVFNIETSLIFEND